MQGVSPAFDRDAFLAGKQTPLFFGSAINNFGVKEVLDALVEFAPPPRAAAGDAARGRARWSRSSPASCSRSRPTWTRGTATAWPSSACARAISSAACGSTNCRTGKDFRPNNVVSFLSQRRELVEDAYAGDIIGIPNHGVLQLGDTLTEGEDLQFTGLPFFAPELFQTVEIADPLRSKQLRTGLAQLGEEGAIQVFRPVAGGMLLLGAVGQLQFEVVAHRLRHEYGCEARLAPARYTLRALGHRGRRRGK